MLRRTQKEDRGAVEQLDGNGEPLPLAAGDTGVQRIALRCSKGDVRGDEKAATRKGNMIGDEAVCAAEATLQQQSLRTTARLDCEARGIRCGSQYAQR